MKKKTWFKKKKKEIRNLLHCIEPSSFEIAESAFLSQESCPCDCQDRERCFLIFQSGEQGSSES